MYYVNWESVTRGKVNIHYKIIQQNILCTVEYNNVVNKYF